VPQARLMAIRMPPDMRAKLEAAAKEEGRTLSQELLSRLRTSFLKDELRAPKTIRALAYIVEIMERRVELLLCGRDRINGNQWRDDSLVFDAFKSGVNWILDQLRPEQSQVQNSVAEGRNPLVAILLNGDDPARRIGERMAQTAFDEVQEKSPDVKRYAKDLQDMVVAKQISVDGMIGSVLIARAKTDAKRDLKLDDPEEE
jgi:hypothetical protein